jgi:putative transposase
LLVILSAITGNDREQKRAGGARRLHRGMRIFPTDKWIRPIPMFHGDGQADRMSSSPQLRIGRIAEHGACYVVTTLIVDRKPILIGNSARCVADELNAREAEGLVRNISWVIMPNHLHWLFELRCDSLATPVQKLKTLSARRINEANGERRPVWQSGYYDHRVRKFEDLKAQAFYIQQNPLRSGLIAPGERFPHAWCRFSEL